MPDLACGEGHTASQRNATWVGRFAQEFNKHLNFTFQTVSNCTSELGHFFAVYFVILVYYGMLAHILFGIQLEQYSDIWSSILIVNELAMPGSYDTGIMQYPTMSVRVSRDLPPAGR